MVKKIESVILFTQDPEKLSNFYKEKVGLKMTVEAEIGEDHEKLYGFEFGEGPGLYIMKHSRVKGKNENPDRIIFNLEAEGEIKEAVRKLADAGVEKIQDIYHVENYGYISTFKDADGNYFQLVKTMP